MNKISVLFLTTSFPRHQNDYAGSFIYRTAKYLAENNIDVKVIAPYDHKSKSQECINSIKIERFQYFYPKRHHRLCYGKGGILANLRTSFLAWIQIPFFIICFILTVIQQRKNINIIHCHWTPTVWIAKIACIISRKKTPIILTNWGSDTRLLPSWITRKTLKLIDGCISSAAETSQHLQQHNYYNFVEIPTPIDEEKFSKNFNQQDFKKELLIDKSTPVISFIGRLNYFKDPITFIKSCAILKERKIEFHALIAGNGDLYEKCKKEIDKLKVKEIVTLLGTREDTEKIFSICTAMVHISPIENTWSTSIAEAMYMNCPVIMTNAGHTQKTFTDQKNCLITKIKDPEDLAQKMESILASKDLRKKITNGAKKLLEEHGKTKEISTKKTINYYKKILKNTYSF